MDRYKIDQYINNLKDELKIITQELQTKIYPDYESNMKIIRQGYLTRRLNYLQDYRDKKYHHADDVLEQNEIQPIEAIFNILKEMNDRITKLENMVNKEKN